MNERWRILARVRDLRARLASNEAARRRQIAAREQATLEQALRHQAHYEHLAAQASASAAASLHTSSNASISGGEAHFSAADAQVLLSYALGARLKAQDAMGPVRRTQLVCQHAQASADEASESYRRAAHRRQVVVSQWQERLRAALRRERERQNEMLLEDRSNNTTTAQEDGP